MEQNTGEWVKKAKAFYKDRPRLVQGAAAGFVLLGLYVAMSGPPSCTSKDHFELTWAQAKNIKSYNIVEVYVGDNFRICHANFKPERIQNFPNAWRLPNGFTYKVMDTVDGEPMITQREGVATVEQMQ